MKNKLNIIYRGCNLESPKDTPRPGRPVGFDKTECFYTLHRSILKSNCVANVYIIIDGDRGYLSDYIDPANYLYEQPYQNVPIINRYFLFNKSLIQVNISEGQSMTNIVESLGATTQQPGTITGVAVQAQVIASPQEQVQQQAQSAQATTAGQKTAFSNALSSGLSKSNKF